MERSKWEKSMIGKQICSATMFVAAVALSLAATTVSGFGCSSDAPSPVYSIVDSVGSDTKGAVLDKNGPDAWQSPTTCVEKEYNLQGTEWSCVEGYLYTCIFEVTGNDCTTIKCGERWTDERKNLVWTSTNHFMHDMAGQASGCERVLPQAGTVHTTKFEWWKSEELVGTYGLSPDNIGLDPSSVAITFGLQDFGKDDAKVCCNVGEQHLTLHFYNTGVEVGEGTVLCVPDPSTGFDLHSPSCDHKLVTTAYVMQSYLGFPDCKGLTKIVVKTDFGNASSSYTLCKNK